MHDIKGFGGQRPAHQNCWSFRWRSQWCGALVPALLVEAGLE